MDQLRYWRCIVIGFDVVSGLKINHQKSELFPVGDVEEVDSLASLLGCKVGWFPTYFGLPLGAPHKSSIVWDSVEERFNRRLAS